ncbi:hypothetical protein SCOCK_540030 [Actinacidiphila cocklensis]|uniref:Uncharacterized protein n=1 Tax=Actinacidiphila cocklensis TaxID=887465 RepID=A0A9W4E1L5_9ACTN|nr:hypothetical protein SCOCK_540030 [Actinacidiphila cocklensis]
MLFYPAYPRHPARMNLSRAFEKKSLAELERFELSSRNRRKSG